MKRQSVQPFLAGGLFLTFFKALAATVLDAVFTGLMGRKTLPKSWEVQQIRPTAGKKAAPSSLVGVLSRRRNTPVVGVVELGKHGDEEVE